MHILVPMAYHQHAAFLSQAQNALQVKPAEGKSTGDGRPMG